MKFNRRTFLKLIAALTVVPLPVRKVNAEVSKLPILPKLPSMPVGTIQPFIGSKIPKGWLLCDGSWFNGSNYPMLAEVLPTNTLPDLNVRTVFDNPHIISDPGHMHSIVDPPHVITPQYIIKT